MFNLLRCYAVILLTATLGFMVSAVSAEMAKNPFSRGQIEEMVAPIALYPDALVTQVLMASTYPLDVVQADRWVKAHPDLQAEALDKAVRVEPWDESVKVMVQFPTVLGFMSENLDWTQDLGDAVLSQLSDLTDAIQKWRREAEAAGSLRSNDKQRVEKAGNTIVIQPASAETLYVPTYDPAKVYGQGAPVTTNYYPAVYSDATASYRVTQPATSAAVVYPATQPTTPVTTPTPDYNEGLIGFGAGALVGGLLTAAIMWDDDDDHIYYGGPGYWGGKSYWSQPAYWNNNGWRSPTNINIDRNLNVDVDRNRINTGDITINKGAIGNQVGNQVTAWQHNPDRRGGVRYRNQETDRRFATQPQISAISRDEARGRLQGKDGLGQAPIQVRKPGEGPGAARPAPGRDKPAMADAYPRLDNRDKAAVKDKPIAQSLPKADASTASRRQVDTAAQRPAATADSRKQRPMSAQAAPARQQAMAKPLAQPGEGAFKADKPRMDRAASNRGAASRASAGLVAGGGGGARAGGARGAGGLGGRGR